MPPSSGQLPSGTDYERLYNSQRGTIKETQRRWDEYRGQMEARLALAQQDVANAQRQLQELTGRNQALTQQVANVPVLQDQANLVPVLQDQVQKLNLAMLYPTIIGQMQVEQVTGEDGVERQERRNAVLQMLMSSSIQGDAWQRMVEDVAGTLGRETVTPRAPDTTMIAPGQPAAPAAAPTALEELQAQRNEASLAGRYEDARALNDQITDLMGSQPS
jgi:hypothetical protein